MSPNNLKEEQGSVDTCLQKGSTLALGYGNGGMNPFTFTVPDGQDVDVCFFKLFVTAKPVDLGSISQSSPFSDLRTRRGESPPSSPDLTESWASIAIPVVQRRARGAPSVVLIETETNQNETIVLESSAVPAQKVDGYSQPRDIGPSPISPAPSIESSEKQTHVSLSLLSTALYLFNVKLAFSMAIQQCTNSERSLVFREIYGRAP